MADTPDDSIIDKVKHFFGADNPAQLHRGKKTYDDIVSEAETGNDATTPSNAGKQSQSTDSWNKY